LNGSIMHITDITAEMIVQQKNVTCQFGITKGRAYAKTLLS